MLRLLHVTSALCLASVATLGLAAPAFAQEAAPRARVAVAPFERLGPADPAYDTLQKHLVDSIAAFPDIDSVSLTPRCGADDGKCLGNVKGLVDAARSLNASHVVHGSVERFIDGYALNIFLVTTKDGGSRKAGRVVKGGAPALRESAAIGACDLLLKDRCVGELRVEGVPGARVFVDRRDVGAVPYTGAIPLGRHAIHVSRGEAFTEERVLSVAFGETLSLLVEDRDGALVLTEAVKSKAGGEAARTASEPKPATVATEPKKEAPSPPATVDVKKEASTTPARTSTPTRPTPTRTTPATSAQLQRPEGTSVLRPIFYSGLIAGGVLGLTGLGFGIGAEVGAAELNEKYAGNQLTPADVDAYGAVRTQSAVANLCFGLAALGLVTAGVAYLLDPPSIESGGKSATGRSASTFAPVFAPTPGGFAVAGQF